MTRSALLSLASELDREALRLRATAEALVDPSAAYRGREQAILGVVRANLTRLAGVVSEEAASAPVRS